MSTNNLDQPFEIRVVLVRPLYERNVGAASRALSNMGVEKFILIAPQCEFTMEAQKAAATGQNALQNKVIYASWDEFWAHEPKDGIRLSFTARDGRGRASRPFKETLQWLKENSEVIKESLDLQKPFVLHLFFGPEDWGLSADDIKDSHFCCNIPTYGENSSLNLAQAVLLGLFILRDTWGGQKTKLDGQQKPRTESLEENTTVFPEQTLKTWLETMNFDLNSKKINVFTVLRRMLLQNTPTQKEWNVLETVLQQSIRRMKK